MKPLEVARLALDSLRTSGPRAVLTVLGVAVATAALTAMVAGGHGLQDNFRRRLVEDGLLQSITVFPGNADDGGRDAGDPTRASRRLDDAALERLRAIQGVKTVTRDIRLPLEVRVQGRNGRVDGSAVGITRDTFADFGKDDMIAGRFFTDPDAREIVITQAMALTLGYTRPKEAVGQEVVARLGGRFFNRALTRSSPLNLFGQNLKVESRLRVVGVAERERIGFGSMGAAFLLPYGEAQKLQDEFVSRIPFASRLGTSFSATVRLHSSRDLERVEKAIERIGYDTMSASGFLKRIKPVMLLVDALLAGVGSIGLAIACLGIANTLITEVLERTREIGILKALGAEDRDVMSLFLVESALIGLGGGILGVLGALGMAWGITLAANAYFIRNGTDPQRIFAFPPWLVAGAIGLAVLGSVLAALYPALRASRLDPAKALRHD